MKKHVLFICLVFLAVVLTAQQRAQMPEKLKNHSERAVMVKYSGDEIIPVNNNYPQGLSTKAFYEEVIGNSQYDLQSNAAVDHRIRLYSDGTIGATWTYGTGTFSDRGTGYNYFDGTSWGAIPSSRLEDSVRTGWPSYAPLGATGEIVIAHTPLHILKRSTKGTGVWEESDIVNPPDASLTWPRIVTVGDTIHIISNTNSSASGGYQGMKTALLYSRSVDGGTTWSHVLPAGMTSAEMLSIGGDNYAWAEPKAGTLAFVVGDKWGDVFLMKSTDGGDNWTKTVIFPHPIPDPMWQTPPVFADTTYVCDGALAVDLDNSGNAHVVFGIQRVLYDPLEDPTNEGAYSYFPFTDGIAYWKEGDAQFSDLNPDVVYANGKLIAWIQDVDGSGVILDNLTTIDEFAKYYLSLSSMPQLTVDDNNDLYLVFVSPNETLFSGTQFYNHVWARKSTDGGTTWSDFSEITGGLTHEYSECVFPSTSKTSDNYIHMMVQVDEEPGLHVRGDEDLVTNNEMIYFRILKTDIGTTSADIAEYNTVNIVQVYPNPAVDFVTIYAVSPIRTDAVVRITTITGQTVFTSQLTINAGSTELSVPVDGFAHGMYIVTVETPNKVFNQKLIIQ